MSALTEDDLRRAAAEGGHIVDRFSGRIGRVVAAYLAAYGTDFRLTIEWGASSGRSTYAISDLQFGARLTAPLEDLALAEILGDRRIENLPDPVYVRTNAGIGSPLYVRAEEASQSEAETGLRG